MTYGQNASLAIGFQSTEDTAQLTTLHWLPLLSESVVVEQPPLVEQKIRGVFEEGSHHPGPITISGDIELEASPAILGVLLKAAFGSATSVRNNQGDYTHKFTPSQQDHNSNFPNPLLTLYKHFQGDTKASVFYNMTVSSLELSIANGEFLKVKLNLLGGRVSDHAAITANYPSETPLSWHQASCHINSTAYGEFTQLSIQVDENLEAVHTLDGNRHPSRIQRSGFRTISLQGSARLGSRTEYQAFLNQAERPFSLSFESGVTLPGNLKESVTMSVPKFRYLELKPTISGPGPLESEFSAKAIYQQNTAALNITLVNTQSAYTITNA